LHPFNDRPSGNYAAGP